MAGSRASWEAMTEGAKSTINSFLKKKPEDKAKVAAEAVGGQVDKTADLIKKRKEEQRKALMGEY